MNTRVNEYVNNDWIKKYIIEGLAYTIGKNVPCKKCVNESHPVQVTSTLRKNALDSFLKNILLRYR